MTCIRMRTWKNASEYQDINLQRKSSDKESLEFFTDPIDYIIVIDQF
jgi:hypothetical protein